MASLRERLAPPFASGSFRVKYGNQLSKLGVPPVAFAAQIAACAGLRNRLVHEYDGIDAERVHEAAAAAVRETRAAIFETRLTAGATQIG